MLGVLLEIGEAARLSLLLLYAPRQPLLLVVAAGVAASVLSRRHVRVLVLVHVVLFFFVLVPLMGLRVHGARSAAAPIKLASYNIFFGRLGREGVLDELASTNADIVVAQATWSSIGDRAKERFPGRNVHVKDELMLVTRFPILAVEEPPPLADGAPAMFVAYTLQTDSGPLRIYNVHPFSPRHALLDDDETESNIYHRERQVAAVRAAVDKGTGPFVIVGDTNLPGWSSIKARYLGDLNDAFEDVGRGFGYSFPAKYPWMRIDRALSDKRVRFTSVGTAPLGRSDHRMLLVSFELAR